MRVGWMAIGMILLAAFGGEAHGGKIIPMSEAEEYGYYMNVPNNTVGPGGTPLPPAINSTTVSYTVNNRVVFTTISGQTGPIDLVFNVQSFGGPTTYTIVFSTRNTTASPAKDFDGFEFELGTGGDVFHSDFALSSPTGASFVSGTLSGAPTPPVETSNSIVWSWPSTSVLGEVGASDTLMAKFIVPDGISTFTLRSEFLSPEPATAAILGIGLTALLRRRRSGGVGITRSV